MSRIIIDIKLSTNSVWTAKKSNDLLLLNCASILTGTHKLLSLFFPVKRFIKVGTLEMRVEVNLVRVTLSESQGRLSHPLGEKVTFGKQIIQDNLKKSVFSSRRSSPVSLAMCTLSKCRFSSFFRCVNTQ